MGMQRPDIASVSRRSACSVGRPPRLRVIQQVDLSYATGNTQVVYICSSKAKLHARRPALQCVPSREALERIEMRYIGDVGTLRLFFAAVQTLQHSPALVVLDDAEIIAPDLLEDARTCALMHSAMAYLSSRLPRPPRLVCCYGTGDGRGMANKAATIKRWLPVTLLMRKEVRPLLLLKPHAHHPQADGLCRVVGGDGKALVFRVDDDRLDVHV